MHSHQLSQKNDSVNFVLFTTFCVICFLLQGSTVTAQGQLTRVKPQRLLQPAQSPPFDLFQDEETKKFDSLPKAEQEAQLATKGPLFPRKYSTSNFSTRVFVKGNSPILVDYALQPNSTALLIVSTATSDLVFELKESEPFRNKFLPDIESLIPLGRTPGERAALVAAALLAKFLLHPEKARRQVVIDLPAEFGEKPEVAKLSIQVFTETDGPKALAYFRLYGIAMGEKAVIARARMRGRVSDLAHHPRGSNGVPQGGGATAIDQIKLKPGTITAGSSPGVKYEIHSRSAFYNVTALFNRDEDVANISYTDTVYSKALGGISENGWLRPKLCKCEWDGKGDGGASRGWHVLEIHAYQSADTRYWATARSYPRRVFVK